MFARRRLAPLLAGGGSPPRRSVPLFAAAFAGAAALLLLWPALDPGLHTFYDRTIAYQADRNSPFSIWGQAPSLEPLRVALLAVTGALALAFAFRPRRKSLTQLAALGAALLILLQITAQHWFYLYIVWFYPLLLVALAGPSEKRAGRPSNGRILRAAEGRESGRGAPRPLQPRD
jgi:hypothetical protein